MTPEEQAELSARLAAAGVANDSASVHMSGTDVVSYVESAIQRRLIAATLPGGLVEYWKLVEAEVRR